MKQPNILLIISDQHRADCLGAYGNREIRTPWIDQLSTESITYENCFCAAPVCTPSRYSLLTGLYPHQHLGYSNRCTVPGGLDTFPRILRDHGYQTKAVGKMHFTPTYLDLGYERMELAEQNGEGRYEDDYHAFLWENNLIDQTDLTDQEIEFRKRAPATYWESFGAGTSNLAEEFHSTTWIGQRAVQALDEWKESGNFLTVSFIKPHHPFDPPQPWDGMYDPSRLSLLPGWTNHGLPQDSAEGYFNNALLSETKLRRVMSRYYATISQIDHWVGQILSKLRDKGLYDDTLVVYTSDHGEYMGYHHMILKGNHMYDPLTRVPLILKPPGGRTAVRSQDLVSLVDLAPTLLSQAGCPTGQFMSGLDLAGSKANDYVICERDRGREYMIRTRKYKLLLASKWEESLFFDLENDPFEMCNQLANASFQNEIAKMKDILCDVVLFRCPPPTHLDTTAGEIKQDNAIRRRNAKSEYVSWVQSKFDAY